MQGTPISTTDDYPRTNHWHFRICETPATHMQASLSFACSSGDEAAVAALLAEGVNPNYYDDVGARVWACTCT